MAARIIALLLVVATLWSLGAATTEARDLAAKGSYAHASLSPGLEPESDRDRSVESHFSDRALAAYAETLGDLPALIPVCYPSSPSFGSAMQLIVASARCRPPPYLDGPRRPPRDPSAVH